MSKDLAKQLEKERRWEVIDLSQFKKDLEPSSIKLEHLEPYLDLLVSNSELKKTNDALKAFQDVLVDQFFSTTNAKSQAEKTLKTTLESVRFVSKDSEEFEKTIKDLQNVMKEAFTDEMEWKDEVIHENSSHLEVSSNGNESMSHYVSMREYSESTFNHQFHSPG